LATPANKPGVSIAPSIIPDKPGEVYADKAYDALSVEEAINTKGGTARPLRKGHRWLAAEKLEAHNRPPRPIRASVAGLSINSFFIASREGICLEMPCSLARIEIIFGIWKRSYYFRSMRWIGLAKARLQVHLGRIASNVKRHWRQQSA
jgi:hypothetical protein